MSRTMRRRFMTRRGDAAQRGSAAQNPIKVPGSFFGLGKFSISLIAQNIFAEYQAVPTGFKRLPEFPPPACLSRVTTS